MSLGYQRARGEAGIHWSSGPHMSGDTRAEQPSEVPKWVTAGAAILGSLFMYFALGLILVLMDLVFGSNWVLSVYEKSNLGFSALAGLIFLAALTAVLGWALRWAAQRYRSATVQAGALVGAIGMALVYLFNILFDPAFGDGPFVLLILVGLGLLVAVAAVAANPSRDPGERTGIDTLWLSLIGGSRHLFDRMSTQSGPTGESTTESTDSKSDGPTDSHHPVSVGRYWLVVGSAFIVSVPIALVEPPLGVGLLSAFLTAYTFSKQIEAKSTEMGDEKSPRDG